MCWQSAKADITSQILQTQVWTLWLFCFTVISGSILSITQPRAAGTQFCCALYSDNKHPWILEPLNCPEQVGVVMLQINCQASGCFSHVWMFSFSKREFLRDGFFFFVTNLFLQFTAAALKIYSEWTLLNSESYFSPKEGCSSFYVRYYSLWVGQQCNFSLWTAPSKSEVIGLFF